MSRVTEKIWNSMIPNFRTAARDGRLDARYLENENMRPTHILDIYKMRRGRYKNVRIWTRLDLGNGRREDLFMTTADNQPIGEIVDIFSSSKELPVEWEGAKSK